MLYLITNYLYGEDKLLGKFQFKKGSEEKMFDIINMSNIIVLDRNSRGTNLDDVEVIISDLPVYEVEVPKVSTEALESTSTETTESTSEAVESTSTEAVESTTPEVTGSSTSVQ